MGMAFILTNLTKNFVSKYKYFIHVVPVYTDFEEDFIYHSAAWSITGV
jgi:hypothetical protein